METKQILAFDVSAEYGHFRKFNTTTSPLSYSIPTRIAVGGLLGAILGMERETGPGKYPQGITPVQEVFGKGLADIAIQLLAPVKKVTIGFNLINTKTSFFEIKNRTQIPFELLKNPSFRIYFSHQDTRLMEELEHRLILHSHHFTPYLGLAQFTANIQWGEKTVGEVVVRTNPEKTSVLTALNLSELTATNPINFDTSSQYLVETMPLSMDRNRIVNEYGEVMVESAVKPISANLTQWVRVPNHGNIVFL